MPNFYFVYPPKHKYHEGWTRVISTNWKIAMIEYEQYYGRDYLNFYEESLFNKLKYPKGEKLIV